MYPSTLTLSKKWLRLLSMICLMLTPIVAKTAQTESSGSETGKDTYFEIKEPLIVNVLSADSIHFLQITTEFKLKNSNMAPLVEMHMAPIKHNLIMLFSDKKFHELQSVNGKRKLREEALKVVQDVMRDKTGDTSIENIFFTSLVIQ